MSGFSGRDGSTRHPNHIEETHSESKPYKCGSLWRNSPYTLTYLSYFSKASADIVRRFERFSDVFS